MKPEIQILAISNVYCRLMNFKNKGDTEEGHVHTFDHGTLVSAGSVVVEKLDLNGNVVSSKLFRAPSFIFVDKNHPHRIVAQEDNTVAACIHALRDIEDNIISPDYMIDETVLADDHKDMELGKKAVSKYFQDRGIIIQPFAVPMDQIKDLMSEEKK